MFFEKLQHQLESIAERPLKTKSKHQKNDSRNNKWSGNVFKKSTLTQNFLIDSASMHKKSSEENYDKFIYSTEEDYPKSSMPKEITSSKFLKTLKRN